MDAVKQCRALLFITAVVTITIVLGIFLAVTPLVKNTQRALAQSKAGARTGCHVCRLDSAEFCSFDKAARTSNRPCGMSCFVSEEEPLMAYPPRANVVCFEDSCAVCVPDSDACYFGRETVAGDYVCTMKCMPEDQFEDPPEMPGEFIACFRQDIQAIA
jgi:hypothetical protein